MGTEADRHSFQINALGEMLNKIGVYGSNSTSHSPYLFHNAVPILGKHFKTSYRNLLKLECHA